MKQLAIIFALLCSLGAAALDNLLPVPDAATMEQDGGWFFLRNAEAIAEQRCDPQTGTFALKIKSMSGYAYYHCYLHPKPGRYTFDVMADGSSENKVIGIEVYSFDAQGTPNMICDFKCDPGSFEKERLTGSFTVPAGSAKIRFGLVLNGKGNVVYTRPALYAGDVSPEKLPGLAEAPASGKSAAVPASRHPTHGNGGPRPALR